MSSKRTKDRVAHAAMTADRIVAVQERRRSGAAGGHDSRPRRQRDRASVKRAAIREYA